MRRIFADVWAVFFASFFDRSKNEEHPLKKHLHLMNNHLLFLFVQERYPRNILLPALTASKRARVIALFLLYSDVSAHPEQGGEKLMA